MRGAGCALLCSLLLSSAALAEEAVADEAGDGDRVGRVFAELGGALLGALLPNVLWVPFVVGSSSGAAQVMLVVTAFLEPLSISTGAWVVHKRLGGQGLWPAALGGTMVGLVVGGAFFAGATSIIASSVRNGNQTPYIGLAGVGATAIAVVATALVLELHHDHTVSATVAPLPGGAMAAVGVRF